MNKLLLEQNEMPSSLYEAKNKTLCTLGMEYEKVYACPNDCILYCNEFTDASECPICETSRWKETKFQKRRRKEYK